MRTISELAFRASATLGLAALASLPTVASAATFTTFTNAAVFKAASGNTGVETFNAVPVGTKVNKVDFGAFTLTFTATKNAPNNSAIVTNSGFSDNSPHVAATMYDNSTLGWFTTYTFEFDEEITEFGGNFLSGNVGKITLDLLGTSLTSPTLAAKDGLFFGFKSDTAFKTVTLRNGNAALDFDNIVFSTGAVPEPATWMMMIVGFGVIGFGLRRRPGGDRIRFAYS